MGERRREGEARERGEGKAATHSDFCLCALDKVSPGADLVVRDGEPAGDCTLFNGGDGLVEVVDVWLDGGQGCANLCEGVLSLLGVWECAVLSCEGGGERGERAESRLDLAAQSRRRRLAPRVGVQER